MELQLLKRLWIFSIHIMWLSLRTLTIEHSSRICLTCFIFLWISYVKICFCLILGMVLVSCRLLGLNYSFGCTLINQYQSLILFFSYHVMPSCAGGNLGNSFSYLRQSWAYIWRTSQYYNKNSSETFLCLDALWLYVKFVFKEIILQSSIQSWSCTGCEFYHM